jgi:hypothetical protein
MSLPLHEFLHALLLAASGNAKALNVALSASNVLFKALQLS